MRNTKTKPPYPPGRPTVHASRAACRISPQRPKILLRVLLLLFNPQYQLTACLLDLFSPRSSSMKSEGRVEYLISDLFHRPPYSRKSRPSSSLAAPPLSSRAIPLTLLSTRHQPLGPAIRDQGPHTYSCTSISFPSTTLVLRRPQLTNQQARCTRHAAPCRSVAVKLTPPCLPRYSRIVHLLESRPPDPYSFPLFGPASTKTCGRCRLLVIPRHVPSYLHTSHPLRRPPSKSIPSPPVCP